MKTRTKGALVVGLYLSVLGIAIVSSIFAIIDPDHVISSIEPIHIRLVSAFLLTGAIFQVEKIYIFFKN